MSTQPQLTREELEKRLGRPQLDEDTINQLFGPDSTPRQRMALLQKLLDETARFAVSSSDVLFRGKFQEHEADYASVKHIAQELWREKKFAKFYDKNPSLKQYEKLVEDAVTAVSSRQDLPDDEDKLLDLIAGEATARVKQFKPEFDPTIPGETQGGTPATTPPPAAPTITPANTDLGGHQGGSARSPAPTKAAPGQADPMWFD